MPTRLNDIETTFHLRVSEALQGLDQIISKTAKAEKAFGSAERSLQVLGKGLSLFGAASTAAFGFAIKGALEEEQQLNQLRATIEGIGDSFEAQRPGIESFIDALTQATRFTDDELRPALNRAILATNSVEKGMEAAALGAKVAAAGFGSLEANATLIARLFEGQVGAIGRLIPEYRDLEERLEAGANEAGLAAEALDRLRSVADRLRPPDSLNLLNKALGELRDAAGKAAFEGLEPLIKKLTEGAIAAENFAQTDFGRTAVQVSSIAGPIAAVVGGLIIFSGQVVKNVRELGNLLSMIPGVTRALNLMALAFAGPGGLIALAIAAGIALAGFTVILNKMGKAADDARDKTFMSDRLTQFRAEMEKLNATIKGFEDGTISSTEAHKEFRKQGLIGIDEARQRAAALAGIVTRLEDEKAASESASKADTEHGDLQAERIDKIIKKLDEEKQANFELDVAKELIFERDKKRGEELLKQAGLFQPLPAAPAEPAFTPIPGQEPGATGIDFLTQDIAPFAEGLGTIEEKLAAIVEKQEGFRTLEESIGAAAEKINFATEQAAILEQRMTEFLANAIDGMATLVVNFGSDLITDFENAGQAAAKFFKQLVSDLIRAIAKALILQAIISSLGPGSRLGRALGGLFQDPRADQLARFEGSRFADLFFQGMFREFNTSQDRMASALTQNRDINRDNSKSMTAIVNEATPETTVEFTDRHVEPRVRQRARQRSSRGTLTDADRDRLIEDHSRRLDELGFA